ncbi:MAG: NUDIX domain-containing protein [Pseudomonadota bacterium]
MTAASGGGPFVGQIADVAMEVDILDEQEAYRGFRRVTTSQYREKDRERISNRELVRAPDAVALVVYDPKLDRLVMVRQFRFGAQVSTGRGFCCEVVAGLIDPGEAPETAAARELEEEAGLTPLRLEKMVSFLTTPGLTDEAIHLFYAEVDASDLATVAGADNENETTYPFMVSLDEALAAVDDNRITNGIAMLAILTFARHRETLVSSAVHP